MASVKMIDPNGDAILLVSPEEGQQGLQGRFRVSSTQLRNKTPYFRALLGSQWAEGQARVSSHPPITTIRGDNLALMEVLLDLLHDRDGSLQMINDSMVIYELCQLVDKYQCQEAVVRQIRTWIDPWAESFETAFNFSQATTLIRCCDLLRDLAGYGNLTRILVRCSDRFDRIDRLYMPAPPGQLSLADAEQGR